MELILTHYTHAVGPSNHYFSGSKSQHTDVGEEVLPFLGTGSSREEALAQMRYQSYKDLLNTFQ